jgi:quercetin dioxygenase-like cupin family protein
MDSGTRGVIGPDAGHRIVNPIGGAMTLKVRDAATHGSYSVHDNVLPPGSPGPRAHRHLHHDEVFYVLSGELTIQIGEAVSRAEAGSFVVVPRGAAHRPSNPSAEPVHVLLLFSPAGMDTFFTEAAERRLPLQAIPSDPAVQAALAEFTARYGYVFVDDLGTPESG